LFYANSFLKILFLIFLLKKLINEKHFPAKEKFSLVFRKVFIFILDGKHFSEVVKNLKMTYYLLIITNLILKFFIVIYFVLIFFLFYPLKFDFYINFGPYFYDCYLFFSYYFFN